VPPVLAAEFRIGTWNIANLHHEDNVPLRQCAQPRDAEDFQRLREYAASLRLDIAALQEIGSPRALARIFPESEYHLIMSSLYRPGAEIRPMADRDIYTAFAIRKSTFPRKPAVEMLEALAVLHVGFDRDCRQSKKSDGKKSIVARPSSRPTRNGMILHLRLDGDRRVSLLNVHLKAACPAQSLSPVYATNLNGTVMSTRYDCRTLVAQARILENWIEQQAELGRSVIVLGDFNRQLNRFVGTNKEDHFWQMINDGQPNGLRLLKVPLGKTAPCWPKGHTLHFKEDVNFVVFDSAVKVVLDPARVEKLPLPFQNDPKYAGKKGEALSDHCPLIAVLEANSLVIE
jgi:endonuclease/exonuclease/phosphatase family metal-dependent hydrolase